jgi:TrpR family trp operon transcriptional repressor
MTQEQNDIALEELSGALARSADQELIAEFLKAILTEYELGEVTSRWALVKLLSEGVTQRAIARDLGLSLCKITRGSRELKRQDSPFARMLGLEPGQGPDGADSVADS